MFNKIFNPFHKNVRTHLTRKICKSNSCSRNFLYHVIINFTLGKIKNGEKEFPIAFKAQHAVTDVPRSADVILQTCLLPQPAKTITGFRKVVKAV